MVRWLTVLLVFVALALSPACSGSGADAPDEIVVSQGALEAMRTYAFSSEALIEFPEDTSMEVTFEGHVQAPDRLQGTLLLNGEFLGFPSELEIIIIGEYSWAREPGGSWESGFYQIVRLASPSFYLEALEFETFRLSPTGSAEMVNGVEAYLVKLNKADVLELLSQATEFTFDPDTMERTIDNADGWLPEDFELDVWIAADGSFPVRLEIEMSGGSNGFGFIESATRLQLRTDLTDIGVDVDIEPPLPIPTASPTPTPTATPTPSGELTDAQRARVTEIVAADPNVQEIIAGGSIGFAHEAWHTSELRILGGYTYVRFIEPRSYEGSLPAIIYDETEASDPPFTVIETDVRLDGIRRLLVLVDLAEERVVQIEVADDE